MYQTQEISSDSKLSSNVQIAKVQECKGESGCSLLPSSPAIDAPQQKTSYYDQPLEEFVSNLLRYGVLLASAIVLAGGFLYLIRHGAEPADYRFFRGEPSMFCSPVGVVKSVFSGSRRGIIQLGLLLLTAIPIARVTFSLLAFVWLRDFTYIIVSLLVLTGLTYSLVGAYL